MPELAEEQISAGAGAPDSPARNAVFTLALKIVGAVFSGGLTILLVRKLGPEDYGIFAVALSVGGILVMVSDFGIAQSAGKLLAEHRHDPEGRNSVLAAALRLKIWVSALFAVALVAFAGLIADAYGIPGLAWPLRVMAISVFFQSMTSLWFTSFEAAGKVSLALRLGFGESVVEVTSTVTLVLLGAGAVGAAGGRAIGYGFAVLLGLLLAMRSLSWRLWGVPGDPTHLRRIAGYAVALLVIDSAMVLFASIDVLLITGFLGAEAAAFFQAPLVVSAVAGFGGLALAGGVGPGLASTLRDEAAINRFFGAIRLLIVVQMILVPFFVVWAYPLVHLFFGASFADSVPVMRGLAPAIFLTGLTTLVTVAVNYMGEARRRVPVAIATLVINVVLDLILIPRIGIVAGAVGTGVALAFYVSAHFWILQETLHPDLRPLLLTVVRALLGAAAMAGVLALAGTGSLSPLEWIAGAVFGLLAYVAVLIVSREVTLAELAGLRSQALSWLRARPAG
jgi:O-antigen/teichoic acid export membrane protein